jgi:hypothetical protein
MEKLQGLVYTSILLAGLVVVWAATVAQDGDHLKIVRQGDTVLVDGKAAPPLSDLPFHRSYIDEDTCLRCHATSRVIDLMGQSYETPKMAHEPRKDCVTCHQLPR